MPSCFRLIVALTGVSLIDAIDLSACSGSAAPPTGNGLDYSGGRATAR